MPLPRAILVAIALEAAGAVAVGGLAVHALTSGGVPVPDVSGLGRQLGSATPPPVVTLSPQLWSGAPPTAAALPAIPEGVLRRLSHDTASTATGEYRILVELEALVRERVVHLLESGG